jgi:hypothetical protein
MILVDANAPLAFVFHDSATRNSMNTRKQKSIAGHYPKLTKRFLRNET